VTRSVRKESRSQYPERVRVLALSLLLLVSYGSTAEIVHKHSGFIPNIDTGSTLRIQNHESGGAPDKNSTSGDVCLICQLHQHLSSSCLHSLLQVDLPSSTRSLTCAKVFSFGAMIATPSLGRAPPVPSSL
jgi:hypothetical protein